MFFSRINPKDLAQRIDPEHHNPNLLAMKKKVQNAFLTSSFRAECKRMNSGPFGSALLASDYVDKEKGVMFIRPQDCKDLIVNTDNENVYISHADNQRLKSSRFSSGAIIITKIGNGIGDMAVVPENILGCNISGNAMGAVLNKHDPYCAISFLRGKYGQAEVKRGLSGGPKPKIDMDSIGDIVFPLMDDLTQKYIGDKVRQAEQLRAWAKGLETELDSFVQRYQPDQKTPTGLSSMVSPDLLTDMLTATTYRDHYIKNQKNLRAKAKTTSIIHFLASVTNGFDDRDELVEGLPYVKVADVRPGYIDLRNAPKIRFSAFEDASAKQKPKLGDLLLTRKGSFGVAAVVMDSSEFLCSSEVFSCKPKKSEFMPVLAWFLNSSAGNMQFWQYSTGTTMPGINQENLANILIPDFSDIDLERFNFLYEQRFKAKMCAELLTDVAKFLVEALIEGQLSEAELIAAEQALQTGNDQLDRLILNRLKTDGVYGQGQPLFADLDQLYSLLEQAGEQ